MQIRQLGTRFQLKFMMMLIFLLLEIN